MTSQRIISQIGKQPNRRVHYQVVSEVHSHVWKQVWELIRDQVCWDQLPIQPCVQDQLRSDLIQL
jgi:hypothetical protein